MDRDEVRMWMRATRHLLLIYNYDSKQVEIILSWFSSFDTSDEIELMGEDLIIAMMDLPDLYSEKESWTSRALLYAPFIIDQDKRSKSNGRV